MSNLLKSAAALLFAGAMLLAGVIAASANTRRVWDLTLPSFHEAFADYFYIGNIMEPSHLTTDNTAMFTHHYNIVTPENMMKPSSMAPRPGTYNLTASNGFMTWAESNNLKVHGHTLVWHSQSAGWLTGSVDNPLTREEARANMQDYINAVAGEYSGRIYSWDVVNEAFTTSVNALVLDWRDALRKFDGGNEASAWYAAYSNGATGDEDGSDYIYDAFVFARLADPHAILFYNDFNETQGGKREAIVMMTNELNQKWANDPQNTDPDRLLIEGLGMQAHYWTADLSPLSVEMTIAEFVQTGAVVGITELDLPLGRYGNFGQPTEENFARQAQLYRELFEVFMKYSDNIDRVTFWGKADPQSWRAQGFPLIFDLNFEAKPAYYSIMSLIYPEMAPEYATSEVSESDTEDGEVSDTPDTASIGDAADPFNAAENTAASDEGLPWWVTGLLGCGAVAIVAVIIFVVAKKKA